MYFPGAGIAFDVEDKVIAFVRVSDGSDGAPHLLPVMHLYTVTPIGHSHIFHSMSYMYVYCAECRIT